MTASIRTKLFLSLSGFVLLFVLLSLASLGFGLEKFYTWQKKALLITTSHTIDQLYQGSPEKLSLELERSANTLGAHIIIFTPEGSIKYSSVSHILNKQPPEPATTSPTSQFRIPPNSMQLIKSSQIIDSQTVLEMQLDQMLKIDFMVLERQLMNGDILIIRQPLAPMSESAIAAAQFMSLTGFLTLLAGCVWAFLFSKRFTQPILDLKQIAQNMARLDFSQKCRVNQDDELGELGNNINHLSDQLDTAISALNQKNQQLLADMEKERALDKMRKSFVSNVSHELKTPLSLLLGYAEGLKENVARDEESKDFYCSVIIDEAEKMDKLVKDLLNLSQLESGLFELKRTDFVLLPLLQDIAKKYMSVLKEKSISLEINVLTSPKVNGDPRRIEQVLLNLFTNALTHVQGEKRIKLWLEDAENRIRVCIYNSGQPIPTDSLEKIWTSFYKIDEARTREFGRYGLGLSIVRAIQEQHGNGYGVKNVFDGVIFWFDLNKAEKAS
ncbi:Adaptive-response sensory-kinase SasA [Sporomusa silvacetica DSM 10669]|uniref:histidine kinase n=1 Tax=Sporomusa silvacetica DSM 10669 TaxID=1123289 RepID=A0ABZ3IG45_9FIRM|nr:ATP-binding protein [Sporomusa silvacetica]OZC16506.1 alkaline phosphatase synthesis sensor protein PhoR [Sporomusa silvacetica DSM 10669]